MEALRFAGALAKGQPSGGGSHVFEGTRASDIEDGEPCAVKTSGGTVRAKSVVVATHFPYYDPNIYFAAMYPTRSYVLGCRLSGPVPQGMYVTQARRTTLSATTRTRAAR